MIMFSKLLLPSSPLSPFSISAPNNHTKLNLVRPVSSSITCLPFRTHMRNVAPLRGKPRLVEPIRATVDGGGFPVSLNPELMPQHVAVILDGNRRWAKLRGLEPEVGHDHMVDALVEFMGLCVKWGIQVATFFMFSTENWSRSKQEVDFLMWRYERLLIDELENFKRSDVNKKMQVCVIQTKFPKTESPTIHWDGGSIPNILRQGVRITTIGDTCKLPSSLQEAIQRTKEATQHNTKTHALFAINYSGKNDIMQACQSIATKVKNGLVDPNDITESHIETELQTMITKVPCPDLLIRTSGEVRISNFLLWQLAYSEMYFTNTLWPDFGEPEFVEALQSFQKRGRRFGGQ